MANPNVSKFTKISTELLEALCKIRISGEARQMFDTIIRKTYGWSKPTDRISTTQFMEATGLSKGAVQRGRKKLVEMNLIGVSKNVYTKALSYHIIKDYDKWKVYTKRYTVYQNVSTVYTKTCPKVYPKKSPTIDNIDTIQKIVVSDKDFLLSLKHNSSYKHIDVEHELGKMDAWLSTRKGRLKTRRFIVNWLNKVEKPIQAQRRMPS